MAASNNEQKAKTDKNYYRVKITESNGKKTAKFRILVPQGTEGAKTETKDGKTLYFNEYDNLSGKITKLWFWTDESKDGLKKWNCLSIELTDENGIIECLTISEASSEYEDFMKRLPNVNYQLPVKLVIYCIPTDKKGKTYWNQFLVMYQNDEKIVSAFSKENPLPDLNPVTVKGAIVWDNTDKLKALKQVGLDFNKRLQGQFEYAKSEAAEVAAQVADHETPKTGKKK